MNELLDATVKSQIIQELLLTEHALLPDINHQDSNGDTALHAVARALPSGLAPFRQSIYHERRFEVLVSLGADPSIVNNDGQSAQDIVDQLWMDPKDVERRNSSGCWAAWRQRRAPWPAHRGAGWRPCPQACEA